jgi:hypothetical protein
VEAVAKQDFAGARIAGDAYLESLSLSVKNAESLFAKLVYVRNAYQTRLRIA